MTIYNPTGIAQAIWDDEKTRDTIQKAVIIDVLDNVSAVPLKLPLEWYITDGSEWVRQTSHRAEEQTNASFTSQLEGKRLGLIYDSGASQVATVQIDNNQISQLPSGPDCVLYPHREISGNSQISDNRLCYWTSHELGDGLHTITLTTMQAIDPSPITCEGGGRLDSCYYFFFDAFEINP